MNGWMEMLERIVMALINFWPGVIQMILNFLEAILSIFG